jgi:hypothetical protein
MKVIKPVGIEIDGCTLYKTETCDLTCYKLNRIGKSVYECCFLVADNPTLGVGELGCKEDEC